MSTETIEAKPEIGQIYKDSSTYFARINEMHDGIPGELKVLSETNASREDHTEITKFCDNGIFISRRTSMTTGGGTFIVDQHAIVIQGEKPTDTFYGFRIRSGHLESVEKSRETESHNSPYAKTQVGLLIATTEQAYKRQMDSASTPPPLHNVEHMVFEHAHPHSPHHNPHGLGLPAIHIMHPEDTIISNT